MWKQSFFQAAEKYQREFQAFGGVQTHECDLRARVVVVGVGDEGSVVQELVEGFAAQFMPVSWTLVIEFVLFVLVLIIFPRGVFAFTRS